MSTEDLYVSSLDDMATYLNILYYGEPGSGKTSAAAAMARLGIVYLVDVESGAKAKPLKALGIPTANIRPVKVASYQDLDRFYWYLRQKLDEGDENIAGVVFDSISEIHDNLIRERVDERHGKAVRKVTAKDGTRVQEVQDDPFLVELGDRGIVTEQLRLLARRFRDLDCHTVFVALAKKDVEGEGVVFLPQLPPKFGGNLRGFVDVVCYNAKAPNVEDASGYLGVFRDTGRFKGKDRLGSLPPVMADPSFDRVLSVTFEDYDLSQDKTQVKYLTRVGTLVDDDEPDTDTEPEAPAEEPTQAE